MLRTNYVFAILSTLTLAAASYADPSERIAPTLLDFASKAKETASSVVVADTTLTLNYDPIRLASCRGKNAQGYEDWTIKAYLAIDGGAPLALDLIAGRGTLFPYAVPVDVIVPRGRKLEIWFKAEDVTGCRQWDSRGGLNYSYPIYHLDEIPSLSFEKDWSVRSYGTLKAGEPVRIHYDLARTTTCRSSGYSGSASWETVVQLEVDRQRIAGASMTFAKSWSERGQQDAIVLLPKGQELSLWFENRGYSYYTAESCLAFDSQFGANFRFPLQ